MAVSPRPARPAPLPRPPQAVFDAAEALANIIVAREVRRLSERKA